MPPAALISATASFTPMLCATPSNAGGPVNGRMSPTTISVSVTPCCCAIAGTAIAASSVAVAKMLNFMVMSPSGLSKLLFANESIPQRPLDPRMAQVMPHTEQPARVEAQERDDREAVQHALDLVRAR